MKNYLNKKLVLRIILIYIIYSVVNSIYFMYQVANCKYQIVECKVYKVIDVIKNPGFGIFYTYHLNGIEYDGYDVEPLLFIDDFKFAIIGETIPLLVCKSNSKYQEVLLSPNEFAEYNINYPDSLAWVKTYLR